MEDDHNSEFRLAGAPLTALAGIDGRGRVIYFGAFSRTLFPGLRIGYVVLPPASCLLPPASCLLPSSPGLSPPGPWPTDSRRACWKGHWRS
ncbi:hypothetical protein [Muricoccus roseus]|uniref:hypothetical protein n=1 Tax=Muricoccus roseus TaxID=198092 RepID=UPI0009347B9F|nr:hypothetical protein [Roseomonas rosea]